MARKRQNANALAIPMTHFSAIILEFPIPGDELLIPAKSTMIFGKDLSDVATLTVPNGRSWQVRLKKRGEKIWLQDGLDDFIKYYSVEYFYNLHFRYEGNSTFFVCIFDPSGAEIDYPCDDDDTKSPVSLALCIKHEEDGDVEIFDIKPLSQQKTGRPTTRRRRGKRRFAFRKVYQTRTRCKKEEQEEPEELTNVGVSGRRNPRANERSHARAFLVENEEDVEMIFSLSFSYSKSRRLVYSKETEKAIHAARVCKLKNPSFMVILRSHNLRQNSLNVPVEFVRRHLNQCSEDIQLQAHNGRRKWPARCFYRKKDGSSTSLKKIGKGWGLFSEDNNLQEGDVCVFELIKKGRDMNVLKVWIYHAADYAGPPRKRLKAK